MAFIQERRANVIQLLGGAFGELGKVRKELAAYFVIFAAITFLPVYDWSYGWLFMVLGFLGYFVGQYFLYRAMLRKAGMLQDDGWRIFEFFVMALLLIVPISIGFNIFWVPGLILVGKWVMAPAYLVGRQRNLVEAIGDSWRASESNTINLTIAATVIGVIWVIVFLPFLFLWEVIDPGNEPFAGILLWMHLLPVLLAGLSISAYRQLSDETASLTSVFS